MDQNIRKTYRTGQKHIQKTTATTSHRQADRQTEL